MSASTDTFLPTAGLVLSLAVLAWLPAQGAQHAPAPDARPSSCFTPNPVRGLAPHGHVYGILTHQQWLYVPVTAGRDTTHLLRIRLTSDTEARPDVGVLRQLAGLSIGTIRAADVEGDSLVLWTEDRRFVARDGEWTAGPNPEPHLYRYNPSARPGTPVGAPAVRFWVPLAWARAWIAEPIPGRRFLVWTSRIAANGRGPDGSGILELGSGGTFHPLPQPSRDDFERLVLGASVDSLAARGYYLEGLEAEIGAFDVRNGEIWFGLSFYDGEGISGVGGWGRFDPRDGRYRIRWGEPAPNLSVSALLHDGEALWLGLVGRHEWSLRAAGLVRLDLSDSSTQRFALPGVVDLLCPADGALWVGSRDGLFRLHGGTLERVW